MLGRIKIKGLTHSSAHHDSKPATDRQGEVANVWVIGDGGSGAAC
jgi:hypothetical protein